MTTKVIVNPNNPDVSDLWKDVPLTDASGNPQVDSQGRIVCRRYVVRGSVGISAEEASAMVTNAVSNTVKVTGDQTIAGDKTFTGSVTVPTPTANTNPVTKKYVDDAIAEVADSANISVVDAEPVSQNNKTVIAYPSPNRLNPLAASIGPSVLWNYSAARDYSVGSIVVYNNRMYLCLTANGAGSTVVTPGTDPAVWSLVPIESELHAGRLIDELVYSISPLTDSSVHLADGSLIAKGAYAQYYNKKLQDYNNAPVVANARQIGNPINVNGVYSGFSDSDYFIQYLPFKPDNNSWELSTKITTGTDISTINMIFQSTNFDESKQYASVELYYTGSHIRANVSSNGTTFFVSLTSDITISANTTYWLKLVFTGSSYIMQYSLDGETFVTTASANSSSVIYQNSSRTRILIGKHVLGSRSLQGSIDLNESYIKINNVLWWSGTTKKGFTNEAYWQSFVSTYGACGKFVLDTVNETIRLPKLTGFLEGTVDVNALSELTEAGLPNVTAYLGINSAETPNRAAYFRGSDRWNGIKSSEGGTAGRVEFDASRSSPIYGNSPTVQPQSISVYVYIVIANAQKTSISVDIDEVMTDVNNLESNKANKDFSNVTDTAKVMMAKASMPSSRYVNLTLGASGAQYTAPTDGYFCITGAPSSAQRCEVALTNVTAHIIGSAFSTGYGLRCFVPCAKNDVVSVEYSSIFDVRNFRFIYAQGAISEA